MEQTVMQALSASRKLVRVGKMAAAENTLKHAALRFPKNRRLHVALAELKAGGTKDMLPEKLLKTGDAWWRDGYQERARQCYETVLKRHPDSITAELGLALVERSTGETQASVARYTKLINRAPTLVDPYRYVSEMRVTQPGDGWIETLSNALQISTAEDARISLSFALGKSLNDIGEVDASFAAYDIANQMRHAQLGKAPIAALAEIAAIVRNFASPPPKPFDLPNWGNAPRPIFIVGLARSGTTLVERILAQHSQVTAGGERSDLTDVLAQVQTRMGWLDRKAAIAIRTAYRTRLPIAEPGIHWITDKMPSNARWIGFIRQAFPEAMIIQTQRDPVAAGWSMYRRYFSSEQMAYAFDLQTIAAFIRAHGNLMTLWHQHCPDVITQVDYDALSSAPAVKIPELLNTLGLEFESACLTPDKHLGSVQTASFEQVRKPIYAGSSSNWQTFESHLGPLLTLMERNRNAA